MQDDNRQIGEILRAARENSGLSVEDVVFRTGLPRSAVLALEAEDFSAFASPVYARSFLSQYSDFLNVDAHGWLEALEPGSFSAAAMLHPVVEAPAEERTPERSGPSAAGGGWLTLLGLSALSVGIVVASIKGYEFFESRFGEPSTPKPVVEVLAPPVPAAAAPTAPVEKLPEPYPLPPPQDIPADPSAPPPRAIIVR